MATTTHRVATPDTSNATSYTSGSFTPGAGELLVAFVMASGTTATGSMTDSQGLGFTKIGAQAVRGSADRLVVFVANARAAATSMTVTFDCTGDAATGVVIAVCGVAEGNRVGSAAVSQFKTALITAGGTPAATYDNNVNAFFPTLGAVGNAANPPTLTPPAGFIEKADTGYDTPTIGLEYATRGGILGSNTVTWGNTSATEAGVIIIEINIGDVLTSSVPDTVTPSDAQAKAVAAPKADTATPADAQAKAETAHPADSTTPSDAISNKPGKVAADSLSLLDSAPAFGVGKGINEAPALADAVQDALALLKGDSVLLSDSPLTAAVYVRAVAESALGLDDQLTALTNLGIQLGDPLSLADAMSKAIGKMTVDSPGLDDNVSRTWGIGFSIPDAIGLGDAVQDVIALLRVELVGLSDTTVNLTAFQRTVDDAASLDETRGMSASHPLTDTISPSDAWSSVFGLRPSDLLPLADNIGPSVTLIRSLTDSASLVDALSKRPRLVKGEPVTLADAVQDAVHLGVGDAAALTDAISRTVAFHRSLSETLALVDAIMKAFGGITVDDAVAILDELSKHPGVGIAEVLGVDDARSLNYISAGLRLRAGRIDQPRVGRPTGPRSGVVVKPRTGERR